MAKIIHGIDPSMIDDPIARKFWQIVKTNFQETDKVFGNAIASGNNPGPAGGPAILTDYLFLPGRIGGQTLVDVDILNSNAPPLTIRTALLSNLGQTKFQMRDPVGNYIGQLGVDVTNPYTTTTDYGGALTLGRTDGNYHPIILAASNDGTDDNTKGVLYCKDMGYIGFTKAIGSLGVGRTEFGLRQSGGSTVGKDLRLTLSNIYSTSIWGTTFLSLAGIGANGHFILSANDAASGTALATMAAAYIHTTAGPSSLASWTQQGIWDWRHAAGNTATPMMIFQGMASQTGDFYRWQLSTGTVMSKLDIAGNLTATSFIGNLTGNVSTLTTRGDLLTRDASSQVRLAIGASGRYLKSNGTDPSWATVTDSDVVSDGTITRWADNGSVVANWDFGAGCGFSADLTGLNPFAYVLDTSTGQSISLNFNTNLSAGATLTFDAAGGIVAMPATTMNFSNKTLTVTNNTLRCLNASSGVVFSDNTTISKALRFRLANMTASTNSLLAFRGSAARTWEFPDVNLTVVGKVGTTEGSNLTDVNLTGQTATIGSTSLVTSPAVGMYRVSIYAATSTAGNGGDTVTVTIGWTDAIGAKTYVTATLDLSTTAAQPLTIALPILVASGNITYATTVVKTGSPQYLLSLRCEAI